MEVCDPEAKVNPIVFRVYVSHVFPTGCSAVKLFSVLRKCVMLNAVVVSVLLNCRFCRFFQVSGGDRFCRNCTNKELPFLVKGESCGAVYVPPGFGYLGLFYFHLISSFTVGRPRV